MLASLKQTREWFYGHSNEEEIIGSLKKEIWKQIQLNLCASKLEAKRVVQMSEKDFMKIFDLAVKNITESVSKG